MVFFLKISLASFHEKWKVAISAMPSNSGSALPRGMSFTKKKMSAATTSPNEPVM